MLEQRNNPKLLIGITGTIIALIVAFLAYQWLGNTASEPLPEHDVAATVTPSNAAASTAVVETSSTEALADPITLIDDSVLTQEVPQNSTLAKEELAKLEDIQVQLKDQEKLLNEQHQDADQLIALKEEQIKILEAQLAQSQ